MINHMNGYAIYETEIGMLRMEYEDDYITHLSIVKDFNKDDDTGVKTELTDKAFLELDEYFKGKRKEFTFPYKLKGTDFQMRVWKSLCDIPYGETKSYKDIAIAIGNEKASRAVGMANNRNPLMIIVPCHRVIGKNGSLVGYGEGLDVKEFLLNLESNNK